MNRNDRLGPRRNRSLDLLGVDQRVRRAYIDEHRTRTCQRHPKCGGGKRHRRYDHLVAIADAQHTAGKMESIRAVRHSDRVWNTAIFGKLLLEEAYFLAEDEIAAVNHFCNRRIDVPNYRITLCSQINKWSWSTKGSNVIH